MVKKGLAILLFVLVTAGFLFGFITYNDRLNKTLNQEIGQISINEPQEYPETPVEEPDAKDPAAEIKEPAEEAPQEVGNEAEVLVKIPDIVGLHKDDAVKRIEETGLTPEIHLEYIEGIEKEFVFYQRPPKNNEVPKGTVVSFSVSRGPYGSSAQVVNVKVPELRGKTLAQAETLLQQNKLGIRTSKVYSDTVTSGLVISQDILPGIVVEEGSSISLVISMGKEQVDVPNVIGLTEAGAKSAIESRGLRISVSKDYSEKTPGTVISQSPAIGKAVRGTAVSVVISSGQKPIEQPVPDPTDPEPPVEEPDDPVETPNG